MQADVQSIQSTHHIYCPLCNAPLTCRTSNDAIGITNGTSSARVFCSSCGYSAPLMSRQHATPSRPRPAQSARSSVWIDPTVSTYLQGEQTAQPSQASPAQVAPATPIPPRASAQRLKAVRVRPRYSYTRPLESMEDDPACIPTLPPPTTWQYESQAYSAESSLSSLSLIVDEPTNPLSDIPHTLNARNAQDTPPHGISRIEEMDTRPPLIAKSTIEGIVDSTISNTQLAIEEQNTVPMQLSPARTNEANGINGTQLTGAASFLPGGTGSPASGSTMGNMTSRALAPIVPAAPVIIEPPNRQVASAEPVSWTAGDAAGSRYAQLVAARTGRVGHIGRRKYVPPFNIFDRLRWWLLHPGRFEFLLWLGGTVLLMTVTCIFVLMTVFSFQWSTSNTNNLPSSSSNANSTSSPANGRTISPDMSLALTNAGQLVAGSPLHLRGQGFSANGRVALTYDTNQPFLNQAGQPVVAQTDAHGTFFVTLNSPHGERASIVLQRATSQQVM